MVTLFVETDDRMGDWISPLVTSPLRLVVITMLYAANFAAVCRIFRQPKYRGVLSYKWITILTILILNLTYLSIVWAPFTIMTFKYSLQGFNSPNGMERMQAPSTYILEYLNKRNGSLVQATKLGQVLSDMSSGQLIIPEGKEHQELIPIGFDQLKKFENDLELPLQLRPLMLGKALNQWITHVQDLVTSSFTYSLILTAVMRKIMAEKGVMVSRWQASICSLILAIMPIPLTLSIRGLANTTNQYALHTSHISKSGYTMYSIICDVNITQNYVVGLFLECAVVLLVAAVLLVVTQKRIKYSLTSPEKDNTCDSLQVEDVACKCVLMMGAGWAWPLKPVLVTVLFCIHGTHWSNVVCWLANMVVAIPVVFMPLTVFLSRTEETQSCTGYDTFTNDPESTEATTEKHHSDKCTQMEVENETEDKDSCKLTVKDVDMSPGGGAVVSSDLLQDVPEKGNQARENLKFYLGTDIFKHKKEDEVCILSESCFTSDGNESHI